MPIKRDDYPSLRDFARALRESERKLRRDHVVDNETRRAMNLATEMWIVFRAPRGQTNHAEVVCWCEDERMADVVLEELRNVPRNPRTVIADASEHRPRHVWMKRPVSYPPLKTMQQALEMCERLAETWSRRALMLKQAIDEHERSQGR